MLNPLFQNSHVPSFTPSSVLGVKTPTLNSELGAAYDLTNQRLLYGKNESVVYEFPASVVKVMTCLLLGETKAANMSDTITWQTSDDIDASFSQVGFANSDVVSWDELLHGMLMVSGGDACQAVARVLGNESASNAIGSTLGYNVFTDMMNQKALDLGCQRALFSNSHGAFMHQISARDLAVIGGACFQNPVVQAMALTTSYTITVTGPSSRSIPLTNGNSLLGNPGVKGSKTGSLSGGIYPTTFSLVTLWTSPSGVDVAIATMASPDTTGRFTDHTNMIASLPTDFPYLSL